MNEQIDNGNELSLSQALEQIKSRNANVFSEEKVNLAELQRLTGISRSKLRRLKKNNFVEKPNGNKGKSASENILSGYESVLNNFLKTNIKNSQVCYERLKELGYEGGLTSVKVYISNHKNLISSPRQIVSPQGNRGRRYNKEGSFNIIFTSNKQPKFWKQCFAEEDTLKCAMDRIFDDVMIFNFSGSSHRGQNREAYNVSTKKVKTVSDSIQEIE